MQDNYARKLQRKINKRIRFINNSIKNDPLWKGRFVLLQKQAIIHEYPDHSGYYGNFVFYIIDKKTGLYKEEIFDNYEIFHSFTLFWAINNFIIQDIKAWEENPSPRDSNLINWVEKPIIKKKRIGFGKCLSGKYYM